MQQYKKVEQTDIQFLKSVFDERHVFVGDEIHEDYFHDEMPEYGSFKPEVLVKATSASQIQQLMKYATQHKIPVTPRGAGTGLCGGCVATIGGILLSVEKLNKIIEIDSATMTAVIEPGVYLMDLIDEVAKEGFLYAPDPGEKSATVGGNVMTNAGGMRAVKYGVTRDYVKGIEMVLPTGELECFGGKIAKNSSGYSLKDLMIGSEGTLGICTKLYLKLLPLPKKMTSLLIPFNSISDCLNCVPIIMNRPYIPITCEFMEKEVILDAQEYLGKSFPDQKSAAYLLVSYGAESKSILEEIIDEIASLVLEHKALDVFISDTDDRQESIWTARGAFLEAIKSSTSTMDECDVVLPLDKMESFLEYVKELQDEYLVRIRSFGHAGDGNIHVYVCKDDMEDARWQEVVKETMSKMYEYAQKCQGQVSGEHGIGHAKTDFLKESLGESQIAIMKGIKNIFDPSMICNPQKVLK